ncbi:exonuclease domain-containing protein [Gracilibacillus dipsosauri]|uniref:DNA polymerase III subunit epsilon n=1 Tax=Gracilibacillus dipsosauri TaxID=178340 RepID=A0A317KWV3_9BACI|nr:exonuclease domain-containing protein [Gracilibacillus dipsosauri]PWU67981.1 DNA polymerase III subunit epsilon [Gracilibacillus dipsosauri]
MVMNQMLQFLKQIYGNQVTSMSSETDPNKIAYIRSLQRELKKKDVLNLPIYELPMVVFDLETTGFSPYHGDRILSIGAIRMVGPRVLTDQLFYKTVNHEWPLSKEIEALTGITAFELKKAAPLVTVLRQFYQFVKSDTLVAHHSSHEKQFMKHASWTELKTSFQHRILDTTFLTKVVANGCNYVSLDDWCNHYGIDIGIRHHALYDAVATARIWSACIRQVEAMGFQSLKEVYAHIARQS